MGTCPCRARLRRAAQTLRVFAQDPLRRHVRQRAAAGRIAGSLGTEPLIGQYINLGARFFLANYDGWIKAGASQYLAKLAGLAAA